MASLVCAVCAAGAQPAGALEVKPTELGGVFSGDATPTFEVTTPADHVAWSVHDLWGNDVASDREPAQNGVARVSVPVDSDGYYTLRVTAPERGGQASLGTTFSLLPNARRSAKDGFTYGVQTHFSHGWDPAMAPLLAKIGVEGIRDSQPWDKIETAPGAYDFTVFGRYMAALEALDIDPLINFGRGNQSYFFGCTPYNEPGRQALGRFAQEVLKHYGDQIERVGIYNEPNLDKFGDYDPGNVGEGNHELCSANARSDRHRAIARVVYRAVKAVRPDVTVSAPELSAGSRGIDDWFDWLTKYLSKDGLEKLDVVSLHPYRPGRSPEGLVKQQIDPVRRHMNANGAKDKPIWITELGWRSGAVGERAQAAYLARAYVLAMEAGVERLHWYNFMDDRADPFGLIHNPSNPAGAYTPKPAYVAYAVMTSQLAGLPFQGRERTRAGVRSYRFGADSWGRPSSVRVMWAPGARKTVTIRSDRPVTVTDMMGKTRVVVPKRGRVALTLSGYPRYVRASTMTLAK